MAKIRNRPETWIAGIVLTIAVVLAVIAGLPTYLKATTAPLHPQPQSTPSVPQSEPPPQWSRAVTQARQVMRAGLAEQNLPGLSVAVGVGDDIVWAEGFGWADIDAQIPVTPEMQFRVGTASTLLTSAGVGVLLEQNRLGLDEEIQAYVPQFPAKPHPVTVQQLMGHVAGLTTDSGDEGPLFSQRCTRPIEGLKAFGNRDLLFEPGTQFRHSKYGWVLVSAAVERASEQPFLTFMREQVFEPLGMTRTGAESPKEENPEDIGGPGEDAPPITFIANVILKPLGILPPDPLPANVRERRRATFYFPRFDANPQYGLHLMRGHNLSCYAGAMAFLSTPSDLVRFGIGINHGKLLQPSTVQLLQSSQQLASGEETGYGLGWDRETVTLAGQPTLAIGHDGESLGGRMMTVMTFPQRGIVVAVASNIAYASTASLALKVAEAFAKR